MNTLFEIKDIRYETDDLVILDNINLEVLKHDFISIAGPSGSGKSTLLKMLSSLVSPTSGSIIYNGKNIDEYDISSYRKEVSYCVQSPVLFGTSVRDNLVFPYLIRDKKFDESRALKLLKEIGLPTFLDKPIHELSGGEKQRIALIRNLQFMPNVLLLDEITSALDQMNREIIWNFIDNIYENERLTILSVTHQQNEIEKASKLIYMEDGKVVK